MLFCLFFTILRTCLKKESVFEIEEGKFLSPKFDEKGLIPVTTTDHKSGEVLMHGYMNEEALKLTIEKKEACYWSRSRNALWHKERQVVLCKKL